MLTVTTLMQDTLDGLNLSIRLATINIIILGIAGHSLNDCFVPSNWNVGSCLFQFLKKAGSGFPSSRKNEHVEWGQKLEKDGCC